MLKSKKELKLRQKKIGRLVGSYNNEINKKHINNMLYTYYKYSFCTG